MEQTYKSQVLLATRYQDSSFPVNCVVYDSFLPWALDVAKEKGIYGASFFTNSATVCAIFSRIHRGLISLPVKPDETPLLLPGLPPLNLPDLPSFVLAPESHPAYLAMNLRQYSNVEKADWVFGNTFEKLEGQCKELIYVFYDSLKAAKGVWDLWPAKLIDNISLSSSPSLSDFFRGDTFAEPVLVDPPHPHAATPRHHRGRHRQMPRICLTANYLVHNHNRSRRGRANAASCIIATLFLLFLVAAAVSFVLFKPKDPKITVTAFQFTKFSVSNGTFNLTFFQFVYVTNPNRDSFTHYDSSLQLVYSGSQVGIVAIPIGEIGGSRTQRM
ncbi:hypothetical protein RHGRI_033543 [Rhododendron griersonianum]|uniref:Late embryogenesis abundant protein LEA-2 subgroup domain-containing protein n=1 Tax=Rhododendron griersonianum TaxID=479676 RepID=A0AAV6HX64_9ERIC|nr:hypothetical protein RHGRI_033543 [Rhododendron griersonianum]